MVHDAPPVVERECLQNGGAIQVLLAIWTSGRLFMHKLSAKWRWG
jgi:hypothetical protein